MENAIVFCCDLVGTQTLRFLIEAGETVDVIVLTRDTPEIEDLARSHDIACLKHFGTPDVLAQLKGRRFRWLLNLWGTAVLRQEVLDIAERRLNIHPGLVPGNRGTDCATWVIRHGIPAGVSLLDMSAELDAGDVYASDEIDVEFPTTGIELAERLKLACVELFKREWPGIRDGHVTPAPQSGTPRSFRRADTLKDRRRDLEGDAATREVFAWLLAHDFSPHSAPRVVSGGKAYDVTISLTPVPGSGSD